jgi:uncharacterized membrane protein
MTSIPMNARPARPRSKVAEIEERVRKALSERQTVARDVEQEYQEKLTLGERVADLVAAFGGSWTFIFSFGGVMLAWMVINSRLLGAGAFDPFPYILLNLALSTLAALQAPIIMMSQNRQASKDRARAEHEYEINLKAELEIGQIHRKLDELREARWPELVETQRRQLEALERVVARLESGKSAG